MKKTFPLAEKLSDYEQKRLNELKDVPNAYIPAFVTSVDNYKVPIDEFIHPKFKVYHDGTLRGDGTIEYPLSVVYSGSSGGSDYNYQPCNICSPNNTIIVNQSTQYNYNLEGTNWGIRYNIDYDSEIYSTLEPSNTEINAELIYEPEEKRALQFNITGNDIENVVTKFSISKNEGDIYPKQIASFTGNFTFGFDPSLYDFYALNVESTGNTNDYGIDLYSGTVTKGTKPEELVFKSEYLALQQRVEALEQQNRDYEELVRRIRHIEDRLPPEYLYYDNAPIGYGDNPDEQLLIG